MLLWFRVFLFLLLATPSWAGLPPTRILDEGVDKGVAFKFDCVGAGIVCSQSGVTGTLTVGTGAGGDSVSVDGVAVTDPNFASTGDVDFVDTANVVTGIVVSVRPAAENSIEALLDLQDLQGAVTDGQVPNTITIDLATTATTANAGDSATSFFSTGTLEVAIGGTGTTTSTGTGAVVLGTSPTITTSLLFAAPTATLGAHTLAGTLDASTNILTNIGNTGTDFIATTGALTLAGVLTGNGGISVPDAQTVTVDGQVLSPIWTKTICSSQTNIREDQCDYITDGTDDDVQIQAAITAIQAGSGIGATQGSDGTSGKGQILFTEGNFTIGATISLKPGIVFQGMGITATRIVAKTNLNADMFAYSGGASPDPAAGVLFKDLFLDGNDANNTSGNVIDTKTSTTALWDLILENVYIYDCAEACLEIDDPWGFRLIHSQIEDSTDYAIVINKGASKTEGAIILGNKIIQNGKGIKINDVNGTLIIGNEINTTGASQNAIEIVNATGANGSGNIIGNNKFWGGVNGVNVGASTVANKIIGNTFSGLSGTDIVNNGTTTVIADNRGDDAIANTDLIQNAVDFNSTVTGIAIADNDYAFFGSSVPNAGLYFGNSLFQFKENDTGLTIFSIDLSGNLAINGDEGDVTIIQGRETTAATAGRNLTLKSGGAVSGGTDLAGGVLVLSSGIATGNGESRIVFQTVSPTQGAGTTDRAPATMMQLDEGNHLEFLAGPTLGISSGCGTGPSASTGYTDTQGKVTMGTGTVTSCVLDFGKAWTNAPACIITGDQTGVQYRATTSTTQLSITSDVTMDGDVVMYHCFGGE